MHSALRASMLTGLCLAGAACGQDVPNSTLVAHSEFGRDIDKLFDILFMGGAVVFVLVEVALLYTIVRFRRREGGPEVRQVHGNAALEITWTLIPAVVLAFIAVPTVRTIFRTQAEAVPDALQVEVIGHQWWWEFRYPQLGVTTANELYLPVGRTVNFALETADVLHSFWIPAIAGKRDLIANRTNYLWFTPDSGNVWNGFCAEFCGTSHANMRFRVFTVTPEEFDTWVAHQKTGPAFPAGVAGAPPAGAADTGRAGASVTAGEVATSTGEQTPAGESAEPPVATPVTSASTGIYPLDRLPRHVVPRTPIPAGLTMSVTRGDAARGAQLYRASPCIACHHIEGVSPGVVGPNLTHIGSRTTIGAGLYQNDFRHMALWLKNSPVMKPGSLMPAMGQGQRDPSGKPAMGAFTDQQIADITAYLLSLK
ncbi:MAG: cytochrome c oxidase subunit II [Gemmatimonadota bacterium]|nr:cytochrome c oxidase subunit II [Gemmatimonadota bacterium]